MTINHSYCVLTLRTALPSGMFVGEGEGTGMMVGIGSGVGSGHMITVGDGFVEGKGILENYEGHDMFIVSGSGSGTGISVTGAHT